MSGKKWANKPDLNDLFWAVGLGLATYGAYLIYFPAAFIVPGVTLFWLGIRRA